jgi:hypothetical protein
LAGTPSFYPFHVNLKKNNKVYIGCRQYRTRILRKKPTHKALFIFLLRVNNHPGAKDRQSQIP